MADMKTLTLGGKTFNIMDEEARAKAIPTVQVGGDTLTWDGNTEGKTTTSFQLDMFGNVATLNACRVSEAVVPVNAMSENNEMETGSSDGTSSSGEEVLMMSEFADDGFCIIGFYQVLVVPTDNYSYSFMEGETTVFPVKGTYFLYSDSGYTSYITIPGFIFGETKIDPAYLYQPDWNQNDSTQPDFIKNRPFGDVVTEVLPETQSTPTDLGGQYAIILDITMFSGDEESLTITLDNVSYTRNAVDMDGDKVFGNQKYTGGADTGEPFCLLVSTAKSAAMLAVDGAGPYTVKIEGIKATKLDPKYVDATAIFYTSVYDDVYLYTDMACTVKATKADVAAAAHNRNLSIKYLTSGIVGAVLTPLTIALVSGDYAEVVVHFDGFTSLYTAEYVPETT